jgi:hypothetical protein
MVSVNAVPPEVMLVGDMLVRVRPGLSTVKLLLVPFSVPPVLVAVRVKLPAFKNVTLCDVNIPLVKASVVPPPEESCPPAELIATVPLKLTTVLLLTS